MARTISDEELQLKRRARRRLIGAIVLVTGIAVVLPMVLDSEPRPVGRDIAVQIPSPDSGTFTTKVAPLSAPKAPDGRPAAGGDMKTAAVAPAGEAPAAAREAAKEMPKEPAKPVAQPEKPRTAKAPPSKKDPAKTEPKAKPSRPATQPAQGQYVVQVIALADADKAQQMQQRIADAGIKSYTEIVKTAKGDVTRVRAGPFATREAAEKAREQLKAIGMNGNITSR